jgi:hypothetical protein
MFAAELLRVADRGPVEARGDDRSGWSAFDPALDGVPGARDRRRHRLGTHGCATAEVEELELGCGLLLRDRLRTEPVAAHPTGTQSGRQSR